MTMLSKLIEDNIKENFENQNYISNYSAFRDFCLKFSDYLFFTSEAVDSKFKSVSFFNRFSRSALKNGGLSERNELVFAPLYSFILEHCYIEALSLLGNFDFSTEVASTISLDLLPRLDKEKDNIKFDTDHDGLRLYSIYGLYTDENSDMSKTDKMYKKMYKVILDEAEYISNKITNIIMSKKCSPNSYFVIKEPDCKTVVLFTDMETAITMIDIDDFNNSMKRLEFNEYNITYFVDKAISIELKKRKKKLKNKIEEAYHKSDLSLSDLLAYF